MDLNKSFEKLTLQIKSYKAEFHSSTGGQPVQDTQHTLHHLPLERDGETNLLSVFQVQRCNDYKALLSLFLCTASRASFPIFHYYFFQGFCTLAFFNSFCFLYYSALALPFFPSSTALQLFYLSKADSSSSPMP